MIWQRTKFRCIHEISRDFGVKSGLRLCTYVSVLGSKVALWKTVGISTVYVSPRHIATYPASNAVLCFFYRRSTNQSHKWVPASWEPCLVSLGQSYSTQIRTVEQSMPYSTSKMPYVKFHEVYTLLENARIAEVGQVGFWILTFYKHLCRSHWKNFYLWFEFTLGLMNPKALSHLYSYAVHAGPRFYLTQSQPKSGDNHHHVGAHHLGPRGHL